MRYRRAVEKLRILAEACESVKNWPPGDLFLLEAHVFGAVLEGADPLEFVEAAEITRTAYVAHKDDDDFIQPGMLYQRVMSPTDRD